MEDVGGGIAGLLRGQGLRAPVRRLLFLGQVHPQQVPAQILEPVAVRVCAAKPGSDLGAIDRGAGHIQVAADDSEVEAGEMEQLGDGRIAEKRLKIGGVVSAAGELHHVAGAVAGRQLRQTQPVALGIEPHGFGVDGDAVAEIQARWQVFPVQFDGCALDFHRQRPSRCTPKRGNGAQEKTRTSTTLRPQVPETCASTNSATWAKRKNGPPRFDGRTRR